jgi:hypothetical protein
MKLMRLSFQLKVRLNWGDFNLQTVGGKTQSENF